MSAVEILGIVCGSLQLAGTAISTARLIRKILDGQAVDPTLQGCSSHLVAISRQVQGSLGSLPTLNVQERQVNDMAKGCNAAAQELVDMIDRLRQMNRMQILLWCLYYKNKLDSAERALGDWERRLHFVIDFHAHYADVIDKLTPAHQAMVKRILEGQDGVRKHATDERLETTKHVTAQSQETRKHVSDEAEQARQNVVNQTQGLHQLVIREGNNNQSHVTKETDRIIQSVIGEADRARSDAVAQASSFAAESMLRQVREAFLESLGYPEIRARQNQVGKPAEGTFTWLFRPEDPNDTTVFADWLGSDDGSMFWISGKAGSGKSTLVNYIMSSGQTPIHLGSWKPGRVLLVSHFFWRPGTEMQKSYKGFLCSVVWQILAESEDDVVDNCQCRISGRSRRRMPATPDDWSIDGLEGCLSWLLDTTRIPIFLAIDGLDELYGDSDLDCFFAHLYSRLVPAAQLKMCISSRPEPILQSRFGSGPHLRVQDLTLSDITHYMTTHIKTPLVWRWGQPFSSEATCDDELPGIQVPGISFKHIVRKLCEKADGVFLWAKLVVERINKGVQRSEPPEDITSWVNQLPSDINLLYQDMWDRSNSSNPTSQRERAGLYFRLMLSFVAWLEGFEFSGLEMMLFALASRPDLCAQLLDAQEMSEDMCRSICDHYRWVVGDVLNRCVGLLELVPDTTWPCEARLGLDCYHVSFTHRTVHDFLVESETGNIMVGSWAESDGDMACRLLRSYLACAKLRFLVAQAETNSTSFFVWFSMYGARKDLSEEPGRLFVVGKTMFEEDILCPYLGPKNIDECVSNERERRSFMSALFVRTALQVFMLHAYMEELVRKGALDQDFLHSLFFEADITINRPGFQPLIRSLLREGLDPNAVEVDHRPRVEKLAPWAMPQRTTLAATIHHALILSRSRHATINYLSQALGVIDQLMTAGANLDQQIYFFISVGDGNMALHTRQGVNSRDAYLHCIYRGDARLVLVALVYLSRELIGDYAQDTTDAENLGLALDRIERRCVDDTQTRGSGAASSVDAICAMNPYRMATNNEFILWTLTKPMSDILAGVVWQFISSRQTSGAGNMANLVLGHLTSVAPGRWVVERGASGGNGDSSRDCRWVPASTEGFFPFIREATALEEVMEYVEMINFRRRAPVHH